MFLGDAKLRGWRLHPLVLPWFRTTNFCTSRMVGINDNKTWPGIKLVTFLSRSAFGLAWPGEISWRKNQPKNLGMLKKIPNWCRSEIAFSKKSWWLFIYVFISFFSGKDVSIKRFWEKNSVTMESMRCFYLDLCMWRICRSCLIHTRDSA